MAVAKDWGKLKAEKVKAPCPTCGAIMWRPVNGLCPACEIMLPTLLELKRKIEERRNQMHEYLVPTREAFQKFCEKVHTGVTREAALKFYETLQSVVLPTWKTMPAGTRACKNYLFAYHPAIDEWQAVIAPNDIAEALRGAYIETMEALRERCNIEFLEAHRCKACVVCDMWRFPARIERGRIEAANEA